MSEDKEVWQHVVAVTRPALLLSPPDFLGEIADRLREAGIQDAVARRDPAPIFDFAVSLAARQGVSNAAAIGFNEVHGGISWAAVERDMRAGPSCPSLRSYWDFAGCGYRKSAGVCTEPDHLPFCPLPRHKLRKGLLNQGAFHLYLFIRDVCDGDFVGWIDRQLARADPGPGMPRRAEVMRASLLDPLRNVVGFGPKVLNMVLAEILLASDFARERWVTTGASFIVVDNLVCAHFHRAGVLRRLNAEHRYGDACYGPGGCAEVIEELARRVDAREFNSAFPAIFPRFVQFSIWLFCAAGGHGICNGNRIDDRSACGQLFCPASPVCDRVPLRP